jgi:predicted transcriptional regulator
MTEISAENLKELKEKYPAVDISKIIAELIKYYRKNPFNSRKKIKYIDQIKDEVILINEDYEGNNKIIEEVSLEQLHKKYEELLYIEDTKRIDIVLAIALSRKMKGIPLWLILVGASGDMKSVQLNAIEDENTMILHNLTSKTIVNGYADKSKYPDLAPEMDKKLIVIPDMAQILKLPPNEKAELWGQLRDLYDGLAGKLSGMGSRAQYKDLHVTLLAGSTPAIDAQILIHQDLGTRELIYRTEGNKNKKDVMWKCFKNESEEKKIKDELKKITNNFINCREIKREEVKEEILEEIMNISGYITYMRACAEIDQYTNTLRNDVYPEEPTRVSKQLKRMYVCLKSLSDNYDDKRALEILWKIGKSSAFPLRIKIFEYLLKVDGELSTSQIAERLHIGKSTTQRELAVMWNMDLVNCRKQETNYPDKFYDYWEINKKHEFIQKILNSIPSKNI